jgi:hemerythrin-like domain-containing protein
MKRKGSPDKRGGASKSPIIKGLEAVAESVGRFAAKTFPESEMTDAVEMLEADHAKVKELFDDFEAAEDHREKRRIAQTTLRELTIHAALEEEIVYPAIRALDDDEEHEEKMDEALEEHHAARLLIAELEGRGSDTERYDAKFKVLAEMVRHHIEEEENEVLPKARGSLDLEELGQQMARRKEKLLEGEEVRSRTRKAPRGAGHGAGTARRRSHTAATAKRDGRRR